MYQWRLCVTLSSMSTSVSEHRIPELTLGWRLRMALGEHKAEWMAQQLGVSRQTITRWMHDNGAAPARAYILQWALMTGTDQEWLEHGKTPTKPEPDGGLEVARTREDSNLQPSDPKVRGSRFRLVGIDEAA